MSRVNVGLWRKAFGIQHGQTVGALPTQSGRVSKVDGSPDYWQVNEDRCVEIGVHLDDGRELWVEGCPGGGSVRGFYALPAEGDEVVVAFPGGDEHDGYLLAVYPTGGAPTDLQPGRVLVIGAEVLVYDADKATTEPLVKKSEFDGHTHQLPVMTVPISGPAGTTAVAVAPTPTPYIGPTAGAAPVTGTTVLKAK